MSTENKNSLKVVANLYLRFSDIKSGAYERNGKLFYYFMFPEIEQKPIWPTYAESLYPDVCSCGNKFSPTGSVLRSHCFVCKERIETLKFKITILSAKLNIPYMFLESIFTEVIYETRIRQPS